MNFEQKTKKAVAAAVVYGKAKALFFGRVLNEAQKKRIAATVPLYALEKEFEMALHQAYSAKRRYSVAEKKRLFKILQAGFPAWRGGDYKRAFVAWHI